jgi:SAM-dependent methyltransferase
MPIDRLWGASRGKPVDRVYIERFLERHRTHIRGRLVEVNDARYTERYGSCIERIDVLDIDAANSRATIVADLQDAPHIPADRFDCVILTQVLHLVYDVPAALRTAHRILAPGGVLLATVPGITKVSSYEQERFSEFWRFTALSARRRAEDPFGVGNVDVETFGNVLTAVATLYGLAADDLSPRDVDFHDADYEVTIGIRAIKRP